jgi:hypothetical protein
LRGFLDGEIGAHLDRLLGGGARAVKVLRVECPDESMLADPIHVAERELDNSLVYIKSRAGKFHETGEIIITVAALGASIDDAESDLEGAIAEVSRQLSKVGIAVLEAEEN